LRENGQRNQIQGGYYVKEGGYYVKEGEPYYVKEENKIRRDPYYVKEGKNFFDLPFLIHQKIKKRAA